MRVQIPEISWHNRDPVLSVDFQPKNADSKDSILRLASSGTDTHVIIWYVTCSESLQIELAADLCKHQRSVNVVRWSPSGEFLASGDDENIIFIWHKKEVDNNSGDLFDDDDDDQNKETWLTYKTLRGHLEDIYDLAWSPKSTQLLSGSVDNTAIVWDAKRGKKVALLNDHKGFVQGVAWDPKGKYLATLSTDRYFRLFYTQTFKPFRRLNKARYPVDKESPFFDKTFRLFHDDTLQTFYRRLCFSPCGELIFLPSGIMEDLSSGSRPGNTTFIFTRYNTKMPAIILPAVDQYTIAVRCCPVLFTIRKHNENVRPMIALPYRVVFAVATKNSVFLYDTQQRMPFGVIANIHYARLTDLAWSSDGSILVVSSVDGFCTMVSFEDGELGTVYTPTDVDSEESDTESIISKKSEIRSAPSGVETPNLGKVFKTETFENTKLQNEEPMDVDNEPKSDVQSIQLGANKKVITTRSNSIEIQIPETIIATTDQFEEPDNIAKPATPIAVRRIPRNQIGSPSVSAPRSPSAHKTNTSETKIPPRSLAKQLKKVRQDNRADPPEQEEALDSWPKPIDDNALKSKDNETNVSAIKSDQLDDASEDIHLFYDGESEFTNIKSSSEKSSIEAVKPAIPIDLETVTPDSKSTRTPRRVELRTLSTPKAKKKIL